MQYSTTLCALLISLQPTVGAGYLPHRNDIVRRYCEPATPDVNQTDVSSYEKIMLYSPILIDILQIIAVACNQVETIGFTECSNELYVSYSTRILPVFSLLRILQNRFNEPIRCEHMRPLPKPLQ
jgi:hypothetical protein